MEYTEELHAKRVKEMLNQGGDLMKKCPAGENFSDNDPIYDFACEVCCQFIGLETYAGCPCKQLGCKKAEELTWAVLKKKGYL